MRDLNDLIPAGSGWTLTRATDVDDDGTIVGWGTNGSGDVRAFLLTPACKVGGGAAAAVLGLASGRGDTDPDGVFDQLALDAEGAQVGQVQVLTTEPGQTVDYVIDEPSASPGEPTLPVPGTVEGFDDGVAFARTLRVSTNADPNDALVVVSLRFGTDEVAELGAETDQLQLHVLDSSIGSTHGKWIPAGRDVGLAEPSMVLGESGRWEQSDGAIDYWAVRDSGGTFAVGKAMVDQPVGAPVAGGPRACGVAAIQLFPPVFAALLIARFLRRS
jgi:probable HAF family extracellular repeat protein